jgi:DNA-binding CsgD family transcriptional regulator
VADEYLNAMVYALPDPVACIDAGGCVVTWNKGAAALFLLAEEGVLGRPLQEVIRARHPLTDGAHLSVSRSDGTPLELTLAISRDARGARSLVVFQSDQGKTDPRDDLSPRLLQTLDALLKGQPEKQIASDLGISPHTVHDYVKVLYRKYGVNSRAELLALVLAPRTPPWDVG